METRMDKVVQLDPNETNYPAVDAAYGFVIPSYQMMASRLEAVDNRLTALMTLAATLTLGAPVFARAVRADIPLLSPFFVVAVLLFLVIAISGVMGRTRGSVTLPNPMIFYRESLHESDWSFKKNAIYFAGLAFAENADTIRIKGNIAIGITIAFLLEVFSLVVWLVFS